jgi:hypothetical protein
MSRSEIDGMLDFEVEQVGPFRMESFSSGNGVWHSHDLQPGKEAWKPRPTLEDAIVKCITWTGALMIPGMRVIDLSTDAVVWQSTERYPEAGPCIPHPDEAALFERARAELAADRDHVSETLGGE